MPSSDFLADCSDKLYRQFDLAQYLHSNISEEDKERLLWDPSTGVFAGFKPRFGWKVRKNDQSLTMADNRCSENPERLMALNNSTSIPRNLQITTEFQNAFCLSWMKSQLSAK